MGTLLTDIRVGLRVLAKDRAFTVTAALTLAVCIGANTALFSVVRGVLLKPLPIPDPDSVIVAGNVYPGAGVTISIGASVPNYFDRLRDASSVFAEQAIFRRDDLSIDERGTPTRVPVMKVTPSFFRVIGVEPQLGRTFAQDEGEEGKANKVVLSYAFWQSHFGGDPDVVGRDLRMDGRPHTVVGVMGRPFRFLDDDILMWAPLTLTAEEKSDDRRHSNNVVYIARLKPGVALAQAQAQINAINAANLERFPELKEVLVNARFRTDLKRLQDQMVEDIRQSLYLLWGGALFVLLIGGVNVANLVLARARVRMKELATRLALGAGTWRLIQQLVIENLVLTFGSAVAGLALGWGLLRLLTMMNLETLPRASEIALDALATLYTFGIAAMIGLFLGLIPILAVMPTSLLTVLREEGRTGTSGAGAKTLRRGLVIAQVACAFVLLVGAGLLFASFRNVLSVDPGFTTERVLTAAVSLPKTRYPDSAAYQRFTAEALRRVRALPTVTAAGVTDTIPFGNSLSSTAILAEGYQARPGESLIAPNRVTVSDGYFQAIGTRLVSGRYFDERDAPQAPRVVIVDDRLARRFWPGQDPIGRRLYEPGDGPDLTAITEKTKLFTVVGVIKEVKLHNLTDGDNLVGAFYLPMAQEPEDGFTFAIRTTGDPTTLASAVRREIASIDGQLPVFDAHPMAYWTERSLASRRSPTLLSVGFGFVALFLSAIGIYGVLAYLVTQRRKEIGIRVALGSSAAAVFRLVLREGLLLVGLGLVAGGIGAALLGRSFEAQLFGVKASDPSVLAAVAIALAAVAFAACAIPARRATRINPIVALVE